MRTLLVFASVALAAATSLAAQADATVCTNNAKMVLNLSTIKKMYPEKTKADLVEIVKTTHEVISPAPMTSLEALSAMGLINFVMAHTTDAPERAAATFFQECMAAANK